MPAYINDKTVCRGKNGFHQKGDAERSDCRRVVGKFRGLRAIHHGAKPDVVAVFDYDAFDIRRFDSADAVISLLIFSVVGALTVQLTFLLTIEKSNAATATVLQFLSPTIIVAWFSLVRKSRPGILVFCAILTSLVGTFLLVTHGNPTSLSISPAALFWGIASAFAAAFYTTYPSTLIARYGTLPVVGWSMLIGGLILLPFYARQGTNFVVNGSLILAFFYLVVIGTSLTFSLYLKGAQLIGGPKASILSCAEPLSSALLSLLLLGITFTLPDWLGTLLILSSVILISMDSRRRARKINRPARHE